MNKNDSRPNNYRYFDLVVEHLDNDLNKIFNGKFIYPRQFEIHLPADHKTPCNLHCKYCQGNLFNRLVTDAWEIKALALLNKLEGEIPYHIYGGAYSEPLMNPYLMAFLATTKKYNNHFGIHTNGTHLYNLEQTCGFLTELSRLATDKVDYLSISLDGGLAPSWAKAKGIKDDRLFDEIIRGIRKAVELRKANAIRVCYLITEETGTPENFGAIVNTMKDIGIDSLRFSIPYAPFNQSFDVVNEKHNEIMRHDEKYKTLLEPYLSKTKDERPYIFYTGPWFVDINRYTFQHCIYTYYQITYGADGYVYRCSSTAAPNMKLCRLGKITGDIDEFKKMIEESYNPNWNAGNCFSCGGRCNRMGLEINTEFAKLVKDGEIILC